MSGRPSAYLKVNERMCDLKHVTLKYMYLFSKIKSRYLRTQLATKLETAILDIDPYIQQAVKFQRLKKKNNVAVNTKEFLATKQKDGVGKDHPKT